MPSLTKKRHASSLSMSSVPPSKKKKILAPAPRPPKKDLERDSEKENNNRPKRRRLPITASSADRSDAESYPSSDELEGEQVPDEDDEDVPMDEAEDETLSITAATTSHPKDPNAARESHKAQKALLSQRRSSKPHHVLLTEAKRLWSLARQKKKTITASERQKHIRDLMDVMRGKVMDVVIKHDASRIVQTVVKYGGQKERDEMAVELKGCFKELAQNRYSRFLVTKLIRFCPTHRTSILLEFQSQVIRLLLHHEASSVLADAFELYANAYQRNLLLRDFYGKEVTLFTITAGSGEDKEQVKKGLKGLLDGTDPERRRRILAALFENLQKIFNNSDKGAITHAIVHRALWEYISSLPLVPNEVEREKLYREIFETCQDTLAELVHTKDGSRVVREFLALGTAKDRKQIVKALKPHLEKMCLDDEAQMVIFTALDVIDDTKLVSKSLVSEMTNPTMASKLYLSPQGRRSLFYLLVPRSRRHFTPSQISALAETDGTRMRTSKKDPKMREEEIRKSASEALVKWVEQNAENVMREPGGTLVVAEIMLYADGGDKTGASRSLIRAVSVRYPSDDVGRPHPIDLPHTSRLYKTLLQGGHFNHGSKTVEVSPLWDACAFGCMFVDGVERDVLVGICSHGEANGAFVVAELCGALTGSNVAEEARKKVKKWFGTEERKHVEEGQAKGKTVLIEKLKIL